MIWRLDCGSYTLFVIEDGYYWRSPETYYADATEHDWRFHQRDAEGRARMNFGCYLITDGDRTIMVDAGIGEGRYGMPDNMVSGRMPAAVDTLGIDRGSIETVVYSHMHFDHIGGSQRQGEVIFPSARHLFHEKELDHWSKADGDMARSARQIAQSLLDADLVDVIDSDTVVLPGVTVVETFGHTPGHLSLSIHSGGTRTLIGGDVSNHPFQVEHPHWSLPVDNDPVAAASTRDRVFAQLRSSGDTFLAGHYPMPGVGKVVIDDGVRVYQPGSALKVG
jgi:glyoxylase-like metal-dependent hydrolase (beta-lactamase superfamily II)